MEQRAPARFRVAIGGIHTESSTFSQHRTEFADFALKRGEDLLAEYPWIADEGSDVEWVGLVHGLALPGGPVVPAAFDAIIDELIERLVAAGPLDGVMLDLHGAVAVHGRTDVEAALVRRVRDVVGEDVLLSAAMDLHGNVSVPFFSDLDLLTAHRLAPHEDAALTRERAAKNLLHCLRTSERPYRVRVAVPVLLPGERTGTDNEPARSIFARAGSYAGHDGVLDAALWVGFAWADEQRCHAAVVTTGIDRDACTEAATAIATDYWRRRREMVLLGDAREPQAAVHAAAESTASPFFLSDSGDNTTAGGSGDSPELLAELLREASISSGKRRTLVAAVLDPAAVAVCAAAGVGATVEVAVGGHVETRCGAPVALHAQVVGVYPGQPQGGDTAVVRAGGVSVVLTTTRAAFTEAEHYHAIGLRPQDFDIVVVKLGYLFPDLRAMAQGWCMALTRGGTDLVMDRLDFEHVSRPMYPLDDDSRDDIPDFETLILPPRRLSEEKPSR